MSKSLLSTKSLGDGLCACNNCKLRSKDLITMASFVEVSFFIKDVINTVDEDNAAAKSLHFDIISKSGLCRFCNIDMDESLKNSVKKR